MQLAVCILLDLFLLVVFPSVADFVNDLLQGSQNQRQRCTKFMRDVDEETHLHLIDFFTMLLVAAFHLKFGFHAFTQPEKAEYKSDETNESGKEEEDGPPCIIPDRQYDNLDFNAGRRIFEGDKRYFQHRAAQK